MSKITDVVYLTIDSTKSVLSRIDADDDFNINELFSKAIMAVVALVLREGEDIGKNEYDYYILLCQRFKTKPFTKDAMKNLDEKIVLGLFKEAMNEINIVFRKHKLDFEGVKVPIETILFGISALDYGYSEEKKDLLNEVEEILLDINRNT